MTSSDSFTPALDWVPEACTLPTAQQPLRRAEFDELFASAVDNTERLSPQHLRLTLTRAGNPAGDRAGPGRP